MRYTKGLVKSILVDARLRNYNIRLFHFGHHRTLMVTGDKKKQFIIMEWNADKAIVSTRKFLELKKALFLVDKYWSKRTQVDPMWHKSIMKEFGYV